MKKRELFWGSVAITYIIMLILNFLTPLIADDLEYLYKTESFTTILRDEYTQYMTWTGRSIVHIIARVFLLMPKWVFNFINPLAYVLVSILIYRLSTSTISNKYNVVKYLLINIVVWLFIPTFGQVFLWETGSANYLWGSLIMLSFVLMYHLAYIGRTPKIISKNKYFSFFFMIVFGILAGWCNENTSGGVVLLVIAYIFLSKKHGKVSSWMISGLIGSIVGLIIMVIAPGNDVRSTYFARSTWSLPRKLVTGVLKVTQELSVHAMVLLVLTTLVIVISFIVFQKSNKLILSTVYFVTGLATLYVLAVSPAGQNWGRSYYGGILYIIIALFISWPDSIKALDKVLLSGYSAVIIALVVNFTISFIMGVGDIAVSYKKINERYDYLISQRESGNKNPVFGDLEVTGTTSYPAYSSALSHVRRNSDAQVNRSFARYFGLESITSVSESDWENIYQNGDASLMDVYDLTTYLELLANDSNYLVLLSGSVDYSTLGEDILNKLKSIFPNMDTDNEGVVTFSGISSMEKQQVNSTEYSKATSELIGKEMVIESSLSNYQNQNFNWIKINNQEYSRNKPGLNFVVVDKNSLKVLDSVNFSKDDNLDFIGFR
ncbi:DUF3329 domain-containing protein [Enterococcus asini]|uniref:DUF3329 domain-containing protein n=1 Tax=Enterococcus asini TaxID=57732 RepID=UPI0028930FAE|nr:DUF6056 family protein [Enterococcus asini]